MLIVALFAVGCSHPGSPPTSPPTRPMHGSTVTLRGVAENWKVGAFLAGPDIWVDLPDRHWPSEIVGKSVEVKGTMVERHDLPVFINDPNEPPIAGIPVPPGTDLYEASKRLVIEEARWKVVGDGG
jgi:hypothetical protein